MIDKVLKVLMYMEMEMHLYHSTLHKYCKCNKLFILFNRIPKY